MTLAFNVAFWSLPHEIRRAAIRALRPGEFRRLQALRSRESPDASLAPLDQRRCIFVHVPKAAGTSVARSLFGCDAGRHTTIRGYCIAYAKREFDEFYKFTFVRNPWDRLYSAFSYLKDGGRNQVDRQWAGANLADFPEFGSFVTKWLPTADIESTYTHFVPQYRFLRITGDVPAVDFIGRFESMAADYETVRSRLGIASTLSHSNQSSRQVDYRRAYTDDMKEIVAQAYRKDIEIFGYEFEGEKGKRGNLSEKRT